MYVSTLNSLTKTKAAQEVQSDDSLVEFAKLYKKHFGQVLGEEKTRVEADLILELFNLIQPEGEYDECN